MAEAGSLADGEEQTLPDVRWEDFGSKGKALDAAGAAGVAGSHFSPRQAGISRGRIDRNLNSLGVWTVFASG